jgi:hypothetical protein
MGNLIGCLQAACEAAAADDCWLSVCESKDQDFKRDERKHGTM